MAIQRCAKLHLNISIILAEIISDTYSLFQHIRVLFHSAGVMGPDEYHFNISNSVYTNYNAKLSLLLPQYIKEHLKM